MAERTRLNVSADSSERADFFDTVSDLLPKWRKRNRYYYQGISDYCRHVIPEGSSVLEIGCGHGDLLASVKPTRGLGIDLSPRMVAQAQKNHPGLEFRVGCAENLEFDETFDYILVSDLVGLLPDVQRVFKELRKVVSPDTRVVVTYYNYLWEPALKVAEWLRLRMTSPIQNWLPLSDIENLLYLAGFEVVKKGYRFLIPKRLPLISGLANTYLAKMPILRRLCLAEVLIARQIPIEPRSVPSCTVVIPCRNEKGNIEAAFQRVPKLGSGTEIIFIDGNSEDDTVAEIRRCTGEYPNQSVTLLLQGDGVGKGDAVRKAFAKAKNDVLMILDADLTVPPEDLPKFVDALVEGKGDFINGSRLVYPMESQAMRFLNLLGNKFFSMAFTYLLEQQIRDTLCGTKVLYRRDYERIAANRHYFGDFDPFGDFDLLFGAAKLNLKIVEVPIRYRDRTYGTTQISRFRHGLLLLRMTLFAMRKIKFV